MNGEDNISMSDATVESGPAIQGAENDNQESPRVVVRVPLRDEIGEVESDGSEKMDEREVAKIARQFESTVGKIVSLLDGSGVRLVVGRAKTKGFSKTDCAAIEEKVRMTEETKELMTTSGSRICARYIKDPAMLDWMALSGALLDWSGGIIGAIKGLNKIPVIVREEKE